MTSPLFTIERDGAIARLVLGSPPRNTLTLEALDSLGEAVTKLLLVPTEAVIVCGRGRHFSSGADIDELLELTHGSWDAEGSLKRHRRAFDELEHSPVPVVAAISGCCLGVGLELALACHVRIAGDTAVLSLPEASFGLLPGCGGLVRLAQQCGSAVALELSLSGRLVSASEALSLGIVDQVVPRRELEAAAMATARALIAVHRRRQP